MELMSQRDPARDKVLSYERDGRYDYGNSNKAARKGVPSRKAWVNRTFRHAIRAAIEPNDPERTDEVVQRVRRKDWHKSPDLPLVSWVMRRKLAHLSKPSDSSAESSALLDEAERRLYRKRGK
jgi:hypothetical protein